jgi:hypothetical protein
MLALLLVLLATPGSPSGGKRTATFQVRVVVERACSVRVTETVSVVCTRSQIEPPPPVVTRRDGPNGSTMEVDF